MSNAPLRSAKRKTVTLRSQNFSTSRCLLIRSTNQAASSRREKVVERYAKGAREIHQLEISNPPSSSFNLCHRVAPNIPPDSLASRGKSRLREIPLESKPPNLRPNNVPSGFHRRARLST